MVGRIEIIWKSFPYKITSRYLVLSTLDTDTFPKKELGFKKEVQGFTPNLRKAESHSTFKSAYSEI
jgi:hypothetical protein